MPIFETDLTECTGENDGIYVFQTFIVKGKVIQHFDNKSYTYLSKEESELVNNFNTEILDKLKKQHLFGELHSDCKDIMENNILYSVITVHKKFELKDIHDFISTLEAGEYITETIDSLITKHYRLFLNLSVAGIKNLNIEELEVEHTELYNIICNKKSEDSDYFYENNGWSEFRSRLN